MTMPEIMHRILINKSDLTPSRLTWNIANIAKQ